MKDAVELIRKAKRDFNAQRQRAMRRGIAWNLTFDQWHGLWLASGHWEQRGRGGDCYVMTRREHEGPFSVDNVVFRPFVQNKKRDRKWVEMFLAGMSQVEIGKLYGVNKTAVQKVCSEAGYGIEDGGDYRRIRDEAERWRDDRYMAVYGITFAEFVAAGRSLTAIADPGCLLWPGVIGTHGYGVLWATALAHRQAYCDHHGVTEEDIADLVVRHKCDVPKCVNPAHLEIGTQADNMRDMVERGRHGWRGYRPVGATA